MAKALLHSFVNSLNENGQSGSAFLAPWRLSTEDKELADAVGEEFKRLGVGAEALWKIAVAPRRVINLARTAFMRYFDTLKNSIGLNGLAAAAIATPDSIMFSSLTIDGKPNLCLNIDSMEDKASALVMNYVQLRALASPPMEVKLATKSLWTRQVQAMEVFQRRLVTRVEILVRAEADEGIAEAALEYGLRYFLCPCSLRPR